MEAQTIEAVVVPGAEPGTIQHGNVALVQEDSNRTTGNKFMPSDAVETISIEPASPATNMFAEPAMFRDRESAGRALVPAIRAALASIEPRRSSRKAVVVSIPRGGIPLSRIVAAELNLDLDLCLVRRIPGPTSVYGSSIAAVTENGDIVLSQPSAWGVSKKYIETARIDALGDLRTRRLLYKTKPISLKRRDVILIDDCIATGASMLAALHAVRKQRPARIIVAAPFCSKQARERLIGRCDALVTLHIPSVFISCAQFYSSFPQITDIDVFECIQEQRHRALGRNLANMSLDGNEEVRASSSSVTSGSSLDEETESKSDDDLSDFRVYRAVSWADALESDGDKDDSQTTMTTIEKLSHSAPLSPRQL